ncbi:MAG TPA: lipoprotein [Steroidobacteraceae bacterium]
MKAAPVLILIAVAWLAAGCGQKGPLVLPDAQHPRKKLKFPAAPKLGTPATPANPATPATPAKPAAPGSAPDAPGDPAPNAAPPDAVPQS